MRKYRKEIFAILIIVLVGFYWSLFVNHYSDSVHAQGQNASQYVYINTATTTVIRTSSGGYLNSISINGGTGGVVSLYDIASNGCSGTPASGKFAAIASTSTPVTLFYDIYLRNGLCVVTAAATDVTVSYN